MMLTLFNQSWKGRIMIPLGYKDVVLLILNDSTKFNKKKITIDLMNSCKYMLMIY